MSVTINPMGPIFADIGPRDSNLPPTPETHTSSLIQTLFWQEQAITHLQFWDAHKPI
jgi:hypothetical protein